MDKFDKHSIGLDSPACNGAILTPQDGANLTHATRALWIGGVGDVCVVLVSGDTVTFKNASDWMPVRVKQINASYTTATDIVGIW